MPPILSHRVSCLGQDSWWTPPRRHWLNLWSLIADMPSHLTIPHPSIFSSALSVSLSQLLSFFLALHLFTFFPSRQCLLLMSYACIVLLCVLYPLGHTATSNPGSMISNLAIKWLLSVYWTVKIIMCQYTTKMWKRRRKMITGEDRQNNGNKRMKKIINKDTEASVKVKKEKKEYWL